MLAVSTTVVETGSVGTHSALFPTDSTLTVDTLASGTCVCRLVLAVPIQSGSTAAGGRQLGLTDRVQPGATGRSGATQVHDGDGAGRNEWYPRSGRARGLRR
jgi:hypothetical protein